MKNRGVGLVLFIAAFVLTACAPSASNETPPILLFTGTGTSRGGVKAVESVLKARHLEYETVSSRQLNGMSEAQLRSYRLVIIPGGNYITIGKGLMPGTAT